MTVQQALSRVVEGKALTQEEAAASFTEIMEGRVPSSILAAFLTALRMKGETVDEIAGAAQAMRNAALPVSFSGKVLVDTCGTGGDGQGSFNISTAAAFVVAGAGFPVAKHGNRSISSRCGSADLLEELGIVVESSPPKVEQCLRQAGIAFLFAPAFHPATKHAMPVRKELGVRTIFNLLGPLTNPARPTVQVVGVFAERWVEPIAHVLSQLGCRFGAVVHGQGHDELVLSGPTYVAEIWEGQVTLRSWTPEDFGVKTQPGIMLEGGDRKHNADIFLAVLKGERSVYREAVCLNAAVAIRAATAEATSGKMTLGQAYLAAQASIDDRKALQKLESLKEILGTTPSHV